MKNYFTKILSILILSFILFSSNAFAQNLQDAFKTAAPETQPGTGDISKGTPLGFVASEAGYDPASTFDSIIGKIILSVLSLLGIIFLILLIYAGYLWMTAAGNEQQVTKAKSMIATSIIGLIIVLSAYSISFFVLSSLQEGTLQTVSSGG